MSSSGQPVTYLVREKQVLSHPNCLCVIQMSVANTIWYLQFHVVCAKLLLSLGFMPFVLLLILLCSWQTASLLYQKEFLFPMDRLSFFELPGTAGGFLTTKSPLM